jgi:hypothetical protein|tara:strand:- start:274 stop:519 length:246 start_codon:yes stop_codon:yes gene_type:complete
MLVVPRGEYDPDKHIAEGDLVSIDWHDNSVDVGIILKVAIEIRNDDHLCPSEEVLIAEVYIDGSILLFDEEDLIIIEKCKE